MSDTLQYPDVLQEIRGAMTPGRLKLQSKSYIFKNIKTGIVDTVQASDIEKVTWIVRARGYCLKILLSTGTIHRFDGFRDSDYDKLSNFIQKHYNLKIGKRDISVKGWNWGVAHFVGNSLEFDVEKNHLFEVPLCNVSHTVAAKNEVTLAFHQNDDAAVTLYEMRFHVPGNLDADEDNDPVNEFYQNVLSQADIIQATGDAIANFSEVQCLTPRGRYDIKIFQSFMQLHGKTFDYKIPYTDILRLFLLPHKDNRQMFFVVSVDPPIKQGQTRYHFLILLFNKDDETTLELALTEQDIEDKYEGKLTQVMQGPEYEIVSRVMKTLVNRKITVPGTFMGHSGTQSISCSYKATTGFLYPLERGFIFVHKPPLHIRFDEVASVNFARSSGSNKTFDFEVETKIGQNLYHFVSIEKDEYGKLYDFVKNKKLRVKNIGDSIDGKGTYDDMLGSDEDGHDAYLQKVKREGRQRVEEEEDEDSSDDSDFDPDANEILSEPDDEFDSEVESTTDSDEDDSGSGSGKEKKKTEKRSRPVSEKPRKRRERSKKKTKKDPNAPKRPLSGYFLWLNEVRDEIKADNPGFALIEITKKAGEMWRKMEDKSKWDELAATEKEKYKVAMAEYEQHLLDNPLPSEEDEPSSPKEKKKRAPKSKGSPVKGSTTFKSKEYIDEDSSSDDDGDDEADDDKPLKPKKNASPASSPADSPVSGSASESTKEETPKKKKSLTKKKNASASASGSDSESEREETPKKKKKRKQKKSESEEDSPKKRKKSRRQAGGSASEPDELPVEEESAPEDEDQKSSDPHSESE